MGPCAKPFLRHRFLRRFPEIRAQDRHREGLDVQGENEKGLLPVNRIKYQ
jgi:hypothetical protein